MRERLDFRCASVTRCVNTPRPETADRVRHFALLHFYLFAATCSSKHPVPRPPHPDPDVETALAEWNHQRNLSPRCLPRMLRFTAHLAFLVKVANDTLIEILLHPSLGLWHWTITRNSQFSRRHLTVSKGREFQVRERAGLKRQSITCEKQTMHDLHNWHMTNAGPESQFEGKKAYHLRTGGSCGLESWTSRYFGSRKPCRRMRVEAEVLSSRTRLGKSSLVSPTLVPVTMTWVMGDGKVVPGREKPARESRRSFRPRHENAKTTEWLHRTLPTSSQLAEVSIRFPLCEPVTLKCRHHAPTATRPHARNWWGKSVRILESAMVSGDSPCSFFRDTGCLASEQHSTIKHRCSVRQMANHKNRTPIIPIRLSHFHRPALATQPRTTLSTHCSNPQHCQAYPHPHAQHRTLGARFKALVAKNPLNRTARHTIQASSHNSVCSRAHMKRMKDSDDYITVRGANPRTGLISPSVGTRTPYTPDSPGEALKRYSVEQHSPTPARTERPSLCRANEGRKISSGSVRNRSGRETTPQQDHVPGAFPGNQSSHLVGKCQPEVASSELRDDQFVVNMPSAREPQPFSYPGYTAEQIDALEHYRRKARRVSSDGYDRRLFHGQSLCKVYTDCHECTCEDQHVTDARPLPDRQFIPYSDDCYQDRTYEDVEPPILVVRKRPNPRTTRMTHHNADEAIRVSDNHDHNSKKSPLLPPRIPKTPPVNNRRGHHQYASTSTCVEASPPKHSATFENRETLQNFKSSMDSAPRSNPVANLHTGSLPGDQYYSDDDNNNKKNCALPSRQPPESSLLTRLPKVRLVKPEHAAIPKSSRKSSGDRQCSFGCRRDGNSGECGETRRRKVSDATVVRQSSVLFHGPTPGPSSKDRDKDIAEMILEYVTSALRYLGSLQVPRIDTLELLKDPDVSTREKAEALKTVLSLAGHALAVCTMLAMLWQLGAAVIHLLEVVFWPLAVPVRMLRWIVGVG
ncbi:uncharacterized protein MYCFIDRAFT_177791 [Pseudocercospora fijiensis CIRAD86]|uniref:Uncharacterized protein n=1 Tax=Pseudocercospora fijiensis (strain CIRAD86) TaxID=383855 RepID=M2ZJ64_PSEFD|nr:uncharacterized protein MYCFIDRAFT_177791 [Pseudocercospora fijiensis CIRAD86]EME79139.1 hypothetical protein MYCFIDRAFT_177791 [Pseudocercospora fijiensis CIRAD86]